MLTSDPPSTIPETGAPGATFSPVRARGRAAPPAPAGATARASAPLGRCADFVSAPPPDSEEQRRAALRRRYALQGMAQKALPGHRVCDCMRGMVGQLVEVRHHKPTGGASFGGLATCGSAWVCPVCSAKILSRRAAELDEAATIWQDRGGHLMMLTLTLRHNRETPLETYLEGLNEAYRELLGGGNWVRFKKKYGLRGYVTGRDITTGRNGWHPHLHALLFLEGNAARIDIEQMEATIKQRWVDILHRFGFSATIERGAKLQRADNGAADYISKLSTQWSTGKEIASGEGKEALYGNLTIADLLRRADTGNGRAVRLLREYAAAVRSKSRIRFSPGLRTLIWGTEEEETDEAIAAAPGEDGEVLLVLTRPQWRAVVEQEARGQLLAAAVGGNVGRLVVKCAALGLGVEGWQIHYNNWHAKPPGRP